MRPSSISFVERQPRDLAPEAVERREHDGVRRVVDDEVDAGEMLERADVATLAADDAPLHVVGRELDDGHGRLGRVTRGDALQRVGDEVPRTALRLGPRLLLEHAHAAGELVADELLASLEQLRLRLLLRHAGRSARASACSAFFAAFSSSWSCAEVGLAVGDPLVASRELDELPLDLLLLREHALLDLQHRLPAVGELGVDLGAELHRLLARLDLRLAPRGLGLALGVLDDLPAELPRLADAGRAEHLHGEEREHRSPDDSDGDSDPDQHRRLLLRWRWLSTAVRPPPHPASPAGGISPNTLSCARAHARPPAGLPTSGRPPAFRSGCGSGFHSGWMRFRKSPYAGKTSDEACADPTADQSSGANPPTAVSTTSASKPLDASHRAVAGPRPRARDEGAGPLRLRLEPRERVGDRPRRRTPRSSSPNRIAASP